MKGKKFPPNSAGARMISNIPQAYLGESVREVRKRLMKKCRNFKTIDYIYIVDKENVLQGVISIKEFLSVTADVKIEEIMKKDMVVAHPLTHQERIVYLALSRGIKAIPVVDREKHLLGIIPYDTILQIFNQEVREDVFKFGGIFHRVGEELVKVTSPPWTMAKSRVIWLIVGIVGGIVAASIVSVFEGILSAFLVLAAFIPVLVYVSDAAGTQSETLVVRSLAIDPKFSVGSYLLREVKVVSFLATVCGILLGALAAVGWRTALLGAIVGFSMFLGIFAAVLISTLLPLLFKKLNLDPAIPSGPLATLISDITTLAIYFSIAMVFLKYFGLLE